MSRQGSGLPRTTRLEAVKALKAKTRDGYIMRLKSELYVPEQDKIRAELVKTLGLDGDNSITLYDLDHDEEKCSCTTFVRGLLCRFRLNIDSTTADVTRVTSELTDQYRKRSLRDCRNI